MLFYARLNGGHRVAHPGVFASRHRIGSASIVQRFPLYQRFGYACGVPTVDVPLEGPDFELVNLAAATAVNAKLTFVCSPSNPVGSSIGQSAVVQLLRSTTGLIVVDEAYVEFSGSSVARSTS